MKIIYLTKLTDLPAFNTQNEIVESCENEACVDEMDKIEAEIAKCMTTYYETKQKYQAALIDNLKKDLILHKLLNQQTGYNFHAFSGGFPTETLDKLSTYGTAEQYDSTFVLTAVRGMYSHNLSALKNKSYSGLSKTNSKESISPEKMKCLKNIFDKRLEYIESEDFIVSDERKKKFPKHVKNAIESINKVKK